MTNKSRSDTRIIVEAHFSQNYADAYSELPVFLCYLPQAGQRPGPAILQGQAARANILRTVPNPATELRNGGAFNFGCSARRSDRMLGEALRFQ